MLKKIHTIESPGIGYETKCILKIEFDHIFTASNCRDYDNPTFLRKKKKKKKLCGKLIFMEKKFHHV